MCEAIIGFVGAIIGATIGVVTTHIHNKHSISMYIREKRTALYLEIIDDYLKSNSEIELSAQDVLDNFQKLKPELYLFCRAKTFGQLEKVKDIVLQIRDKTAKNESAGELIIANSKEYMKLINYMRDDIGVNW